MERMMDNETFDEVLNSFKEADSIVKRLKTRISELEKENKNLKLIQETNEKQIQNDIKERDELREENKNLKSDLEQFSEAYKRYRDFEKEELAESCYDLEKENKKLKEELSKLKEKYGDIDY